MTPLKAERSQPTHLHRHLPHLFPEEGKKTECAEAIKNSSEIK